jgi:Tol biopolymer transport system component
VVKSTSEGVLKKGLLILFVILLLSATPSLAKFDPAFTWTTLETPHFFIHYHQGEEEIAKRAAVIAEDVHDRLVGRIKWDPEGRTHMVLVDARDDTNGLTTPFPYNHITLFITQPVGEPGFGTIVYEEWMRTLITHEYTHILHLDMVNGIPDYLRYVLGRLYFPNVYEPVWMTEGLATYEETEQTSGGRGRSPGAEMIIRSAVLEERFPRMSQATTFPDFWPAGDVPYLFGESFSRFIAEKYGREKLAEIYVKYSRNGIPLFVDANGRWVLKERYSDLWEEWHNELRTRYGRLRDDLSAKGLTASLPLTGRGYINVSPAFSPDGRLIAYTVSNADEFPGIYMMNADRTGDHKIVENTTSSTSSGQSIAWSPDGGIYYTKEDIVRNTGVYNDIYFFDVKRKREVRITEGLRARDPDPSPDGTKLVFVINRLGRTRLAVADIPKDGNRLVKEGDITFLTVEGAYQYETPRYSPDGTKIVVGLWQPGGYKDIWLLDGRGNKIEELMHDRAVDGNAVWSADGRTIYFSSDRTGIFNLYAYDVATKKISQITNVLGGAFTPSPSPDGRTLVFSSYSSTGYDLHQLLLQPGAWKTAKPYQDPYPSITYADRPVETRTSSYNPLPTLAPRFWFPWYGYSKESRDLWGFLTFGQDAVQRHSYTVTGLYSPTTYRTWYAVNYAYDGLYPTVLLSASDIDGTFSGLLAGPSGARDYVEREKTIGAALVFPLLKFQRQHALTIGYRCKDISALTPLPPGPGPAQGDLVSGRVSYQFNSARQYGFSISPEDGRTIEAGFERLDRSLGSDFDVSKYTADWHEYIDFPWKHHVLLARAFYGMSSGDVIPQRAFQLGGDNPGNSTIPIDSEAVYLRGYPINAFLGRKAALASFEYRFPIQDIESGWNNAPIFFRRLHGAVFAEAGNAWDNGFHGPDFKRAVGGELRLDTDLVYYLPITFRLVFAEGLDEKGESQIYLSLWMPALF